MSVILEIAGIAFLMSSLSVGLQTKSGSREKMKKMQAGMKHKQKRMDALQKQDRHEEVKALQKEMMSEMNASMMGTMKQSFVVLAFAMPVFWFMGERYAEAQVIVPLIGSIGWLWWYVICAIFISLTLTKILDKVKK